MSLLHTTTGANSLQDSYAGGTTLVGRGSLHARCCLDKPNLRAAEPHTLVLADRGVSVGQGRWEEGVGGLLEGSGTQEPSYPSRVCHRILS